MDKQKAYQILRSFVDGVIPGKDREIVVRWLISDKDVDVKDAALKDIWKATDAYTDNNSLQQSLDSFRQNRINLTSQNRYSIVMKFLMHYVAILFLPIMAGLTVWWISSDYYSKSNKMIECYVPNGNVKSVVLPDGTIVFVNSGTTLLYPNIFTGSTRQVYLCGEAHFEVAKDAQHPFIVRVGQLNVQVLGTHFNIDAYSDNDDVTTTLEEGSVKLCDSGANKILCVLKPNEQVVFNRRKRQYTKFTVDAMNYSSWIHGDLNFDNQSMDKIISIIEHHFDVKIMVDHTLNMEKEYTMNFKPYENIDDVLKVLSALSGDILYKKENRIVKLYRSRKEVGK